MVKYKIEYMLTQAVGVVARALPFRSALFVGDLIGDLFYYIVRSRKAVALQNLSLTFHNKSKKELKKILHNNYRHFGRMVIEFARLPLFNQEKISQQIPINNKEYLEELIRLQKGVIILTGHFGNWEYLAAALANIGTPLHCVFKQQKNLAIDNIIKQYRTKVGLLPYKIKGDAARGVISALKNKAMVIILFDQDAGGKGKFVDFLGRPASTSDGPATIAVKYKVPVIMAFGIREENGLIKVHLHKFPDINQFPNTEQGRIQFLIEYNKILEKYIRKYPEQWFWLHRRWKTQPPKKM